MLGGDGLHLKRGAAHTKNDLTNSRLLINAARTLRTETDGPGAVRRGVRPVEYAHKDGKVKRLSGRFVTEEDGIIRGSLTTNCQKGQSELHPEQLN